MSNRLRLSLNSKTTPRGRERTDGRGTTYPHFPNSFGLPAGETCPGATAFCDAYCYAVDTEGRTNVYRNMQTNLGILRDKTTEEMYALLSEMMSEYRVLVEKHGIAPHEDVFRIHWDGDFFSVEYAQAWREVILENPATKFWVYTRSFRDPVNVVPTLYGLPNLALYLSVDEGNADDAIAVRTDYPKILMAFCAEDQYQAEEVAKYVGKTRTTVCPENIGKLALMSDGQGACITCMLCPKQRPNILFVDSKEYDVRNGQDPLPFLEEIPVVLTRARRKLSFDGSLL